MFRYAATIFVSAFLLFQVQPLLGRYILPWFGGGPSIWTTCMLFFQLLLLGGYLYAHIISVKLSARAQAIAHLVLLGVSLAFLPIAPSPAWKPDATQVPALQILLLLLATVGGPYLVLASTGPLMQQWFSRSEPNRSPYRLYSLSNVGSLLALLSYPFVVEPSLTLKAQVLTWSATYLVFVSLAAWCAVRLFRDAQNTATAPQHAPELAHGESALTQRPKFGRMLMWLLLAAFGSAMLLATTNQLCLDVATVPFLWVLPLSLYLITFIICFDNPLWYDRRVFGILLSIATPTAYYMLYENVDISVGNQIFLYSTAMFACCMTCHGELVRSRPHPRYLTLFYLLVSAGGALGGICVALLAPVVFTGYWEYHLALFGCCLLTLVAWVVDRVWRQADDSSFWSFAVVAGVQCACVYQFVYLKLVDIDTLDQTILFGVFGLLILIGLSMSATFEQRTAALFWIWFAVGVVTALWFAGYGRMLLPGDMWSYRYDLAIILGVFSSLAIGAILVVLQQKLGATWVRILRPAVFVAGSVVAVWCMHNDSSIDTSTAQVMAGVCIASALIDWGLALVPITRSVSWGFWFWGPILTILVALGGELLDLVGIQRDDIVHRSRNFYGVLRVEREEGEMGVYEHGEKYQLMHGQIQHGFQYTDEAWKRTPTSYYGPDSGLGLSIRGTRELAENTDKHMLRVGVVGLGTGTIAAYGQRGEFFRYYEINPDVRALSGKYFTYLTDTPATTEVVIGDARVVMERQLAAGEISSFDVLAIDAFSSDAIPVHLLTTQCADIYRQLLRPGGVLAVHISNRFLDLEPITRGMADHLGWKAIRISSEDDAMQGVFDATWVLLTNNQAFVEQERIQSAASAWSLGHDPITWTDDYSGLWKVLSF